MSNNNAPGMTVEHPEERNCAFQYAKIHGDLFRRTEIVCDETELTLAEAKDMWNKYYPDLAKHIKSGETGEMVVWVDMPTPTSYGKSLAHISTDAESDGKRIWETKKEYFTTFTQTPQP